VTYQEAMDKAAREYLIELMRAVSGNICQAASIAGYDRPHFYKLLNRHGLNYWDFRPRPYPIGRPKRDTTCADIPDGSHQYTQAARSTARPSA
jgi:hypothetical protein